MIKDENKQYLKKRIVSRYQLCNGPISRHSYPIHYPLLITTTELGKKSFSKTNHIAVCNFWTAFLYRAPDILKVHHIKQKQFIHVRDFLMSVINTLRMVMWGVKVSYRSQPTVYCGVDWESSCSLTWCPQSRITEHWQVAPAQFFFCTYTV